MAITNAMRAALKALSYPDINVKKNYHLARAVREVTAGPFLKPPAYKIWNHRVPCGDHDVPVRIFAPPGEPPHEALLFFHGGGWVTGTINSYTKVCTLMAKMTGRLVAAVDYRLAPEYPFPAALEDCYAVAKEVFSSIQLLNVCPWNITLIGDSAGGNLAAAVSLLARDRGDFLPMRQILIYPATASDHTVNSPFPSVRENGEGYLLTSKRVQDYMELYLGENGDWENPYFAPLLSKDFSAQPRTLLISAEYCPLRDEGEAYGQALRQAGADVTIYRMPDGLHGYFSLPASFPQVRETYRIINDFLSEVKEP